MRDIGINEGQTVLDFGCGSGYYHPYCKIVGNKGKVYVLDKNREKLKELTEMATSQSLLNIEIIRIWEKRKFR